MPTSTSTDFMHYQLRQPLGEGGFGQVFEAWDSKLCRSVAVKRLKHLGTPGHSALLMKEARLAASLRHAAFVKVHAIEDDGDGQSIVMELVHGQTLRQLLRTAPPALPVVLAMVRQVAQAMQEAHANGLAHGDLKPSNLMVQADASVRILDFGLAAHTDDQATTSLMQGDPQGTISYMAPERLTGAPISAASDVYALGVVLYELWTGARPFAQLNGLALAAAQMQSSSDQWPFPPDGPPAAAALVRAMTARAASARLPGMAAVVERIDALAGDVPAVALSSPPTPAPVATTAAGARTRTGAWLGTRKHLIAAASVLLVALVVTWQSAPYWPMWQDAMRPYSASQEMKQGLEALRLFDLPGELDLAEQHFNRVLAHDGEHAGASAGLALVYAYRYLSNEEDEVWWRKADASAQLALQRDQQLALAHVAQARVLELHDKKAQALVEVDRALLLDPNNLFGLVAKVSILRGLGRTADAKAEAQTGARLYPQETSFPHFIGQFLYVEHDYAGAEVAYRLAIRLRPDSSGAYASLYRALVAQNRDAAALQALQEGLQLRPSAMLYTNLGNALFQRADYAGAAAAFENAVAPDKGGMPAYYLNWANLGDALLWIPGRKEQARHAYDKAIALLAPRLARAPDDITSVSRMGLYLARSGKRGEAQAAIAHALALAPQNAGVRFRAGLAYELIGERAAAIAQLVQARALGYAVKNIDSEPDLAALRRDARYPQD